MVKNRRLFTAGKRLRALRELMGLSRPQFAELVGMTAKRLENIENELQRMPRRGLREGLRNLPGVQRLDRL
ncbi:Helix-turn-helix domain [Pseudomonas aeruginosa]|nr:Helix-turn-helix domain [Pseudomonas aeruginosa]